MQKEGGDEVHHQRLQILQLGIDLERGWCRRHPEGVGEGVEDKLDGNEPELGTKLAIQLGSGGAGSLLPSQGQ